MIILKKIQQPKSLKSNRLKYSAGFTLSELLVAISITLLLLGGIYTAYKISHDSFNFGSTKIDLTQNAKIGLERISRELRETNRITTVLPPTREDPSNPPAHEITFQDANSTKIQYVNYYLSDTNLNRRLYHYYLSGNPDSWVAYDAFNAQISLDEEQTLSNNITNIEFFGLSVVTINLTAQQGSETINLTSQIKPRNI